MVPFPLETAGHRGAGGLTPDNGIVERFRKAMFDALYRIAFRKKLYETIEDLQTDLDLWMCGFNEARPHQGKWCFPH
jgi:transposase InsO family protein